MLVLFIYDFPDDLDTNIRLKKIASGANKSYSDSTKSAMTNTNNIAFEKTEFVQIDSKKCEVQSVVTKVDKSNSMGNDMYSILKKQAK